MNKGDTIAVTGAAGLAGSAVVSYLRTQGFTSVVPITRADADLTDANETRYVFRQIGRAHVFHAAATVYGLGGNMKNQAKAFYDNTMINTNVIDAAYRAGARKITAMGTNAVYADSNMPFREMDIFNGRPHGGESGYGQAKRGMLAMLEAYRESYRLPFTYIVSGNLYGPGDKFDPVNGHVIPTLIWKFHNALKTGGDVYLWGDGTPRRDFLYSKDLARIAEVLMSEPVEGAINIGHGQSCSIKEAAFWLSHVTGLPMTRVRFDSTKPNGRLTCTSDLSRLRELGFIPDYSLVRGLKKTWEWYCERHPIR